MRAGSGGSEPTIPYPVYVCGLPGTGKTSLCHALAKELGSYHVPEFLCAIPSDFWQLSPERPPQEVERAIRWCYVQVLRKERIIRQLSGSPVVCDRSPLDLLAYADALSVEVATALRGSMLRVHWTDGVLLLLSPPARVVHLARLTKRDGLTID